MVEFAKKAKTDLTANGKVETDLTGNDKVVELSGLAVMHVIVLQPLSA